MAEPFIPIYLDKRRKLRFKHKDLRDVVAATGKTIGQLMSDPFNGYNHLLLYALRWNDLQLSEDKISEFMDLWVTEPDPDTGLTRTTNDLGRKLLEALNASGFISIKADEPLVDEDAEGNARPGAQVHTLRSAASGNT